MNSSHQSLSSFRSEKPVKDIQNEQSEAPFDEDDDLEEDDMDEEFDQYDELGRTPPRTRMFNNRKWKDNKKHMSDLG